MHRSFNSFDWTSIGRSMDEYWTKYRAGIGEAYFSCLLCALFDSHCCRFMGNDFVMFLNQVRDEAVKKHHFDTFRIFLEIILAYASFCLPCIAMRDLQPAIIKPLISFLFSILTAISVFTIKSLRPIKLFCLSRCQQSSPIFSNQSQNLSSQILRMLMSDGLVVNFRAIDGTIQLAPQTIEQMVVCQIAFLVGVKVVLQIARKSMFPSTLLFGLVFVLNHF